jgi:CheY-like chemotaxis protein
MFDSAASMPAAVSGDRQNGRPTQGTALVVEDHSDSRELTTFLLKTFGYNVLEAGNADKALQLAADNHLDLIITDLGLPEMDGLEFIQLVRELKQDEPELRIVMLTAYDRADVFKAGYGFLLPKPIDLDKFRAIIELPQSRSQSEFQGYGSVAYTAARHPGTPSLRCS